MADIIIAYDARMYDQLVYLKNTNISYLKNRKESISYALKYIGSYLDDNVKSINSKCDSTVTSIQFGISGSSKTSNLIQALSEIKEQYPYQDGKISSCRENLQFEIDRIDREINKLREDIADIRINQRKAKRAYEEALRKQSGD